VIVNVAVSETLRTTSLAAAEPLTEDSLAIGNPRRLEQAVALANDMPSFCDWRIVSESLPSQWR
jgi:hypothetical protein